MLAPGDTGPGRGQALRAGAPHGPRSQPVLALAHSLGSCLSVSSRRRARLAGALTQRMTSRLKNNTTTGVSGSILTFSASWVG